MCGFRNDDGIVQTLQTFRTVDIPRESQVGVRERGREGGILTDFLIYFAFLQNDLNLWQGNVCLNFLDELLKWMKETVSRDDLQ